MSLCRLSATAQLPPVPASRFFVSLALLSFSCRAWLSLCQDPSLIPMLTTFYACKTGTTVTSTLWPMLRAICFSQVRPPHLLVGFQDIKSEIWACALFLAPEERKRVVVGRRLPTGTCITTLLAARWKRGASALVYPRATSHTCTPSSPSYPSSRVAIRCAEDTTCEPAEEAARGPCFDVLMHRAQLSASFPSVLLFHCFPSSVWNGGNGLAILFPSLSVHCRGLHVLPQPTPPMFPCVRSAGKHSIRCLATGSLK